MKLALGGDLQNVYSEIYWLVSRLHFNPEYIDTLAPAERRIYLSKYEQELQDEQEQNKKTSQPRSKILGDIKEYM